MSSPSNSLMQSKERRSLQRWTDQKQEADTCEQMSTPKSIWQHHSKAEQLSHCDQPMPLQERHPHYCCGGHRCYRLVAVGGEQRSSCEHCTSCSLEMKWLATDSSLPHTGKSILMPAASGMHAHQTCCCTQGPVLAADAGVVCVAGGQDACPPLSAVLLKTRAGTPDALLPKDSPT